MKNKNSFKQKQNDANGNDLYISVRKLKLIPVMFIDGKEKRNPEVYQFIRNSMYAQNKALNLTMGYYGMLYYKYQQNFKSEAYQEEFKALSFSKKSSLFSELSFGTGIGTLSLVKQKAQKDFSADIKNGLASGERSLRNYKRDVPLMTSGKHLKFYYDIDEYKGCLYIKWVNGIHFKVVVGRKDKDQVELMHTLNKIVNNEYKLGQSQFFFKEDKKTKKQQLMISLLYKFEVPKKEKKEENIMGIDLGISIPAYACLGTQTCVRRSFGGKEDFIRTRKQFKERYRSLQCRLNISKGGKGRKDKLSHLYNYKEKEKRWAENYNHQISKEIIKFAVEHNVTQINLEKLTKEGFEDKLLGLWSYYQLQQMIEYKAKRESIVVKYIDPAYTSQTCSKCGHVSKDNRKTQADFLCIECGFFLNADHNAAINIARSKNYITKNTKEEKDPIFDKKIEKIENDEMIFR